MKFSEYILNQINGGMKYEKETSNIVQDNEDYRR